MKVIGQICGIDIVRLSKKESEKLAKRSITVKEYIKNQHNCKHLYVGLSVRHMHVVNHSFWLVVRICRKCGHIETKAINQVGFKNGGPSYPRSGWGCNLNKFSWVLNDRPNFDR